MMKTVIFLSLVATQAFAAGDGHHGGPKDLIAPAFNFFVLFGFLIYKIKGPLKDMFDTKSKKVSEILDRAQVKSKEAQVLFDLNNKKIKDVETEALNIQKSAEDDARKYAAEADREIKEKTEKIKSEAIVRVDAEKRSLINNLNKELVDEVIAKSKKIITTDANIKKDLTSRAVKEMIQ